MLIIFPKNFPFSCDMPISPRMAIFRLSLKPVTRQISKTVHYYPRQQVLHLAKDAISSWFVVVCRGSCHGFVVVCDGLWWFSHGGFVVVLDVSLSWFHGGLWWFVVVHDVLFSKILQKKDM